MRRLLIGLLTLLTMGSNAMAVVVTVPDVEALPGETVSFSVSMSEGIADTYTAMTLYAQFPVTGFTTTGVYDVASSWTGASSFVGEVDNTGLATIPFASSNAIPGTAVENLVTVSFTVDAGVALGDYDVTLKATMFEYGTSDKDYAADVTFQVHVVSVHTVVLDENSTTAPLSANGVNIRVLRTINANNWSTICLPFAMSAEQVTAAFGNDVQLADFTGYTTTKDGDDIVGITVNFSPVTVIEANHPYIIKVSSPVTEFTVDGVDVVPEDEPTNATIKRTKKQWSEMIGTYVAETVIEEQMLFLNGGNFWYSTGKTEMKGYRAYFDFYDVLSEVENAAARMFVNIDGVETSIEGLSTGDADETIYDLNGRKVLKPMQHGVYIVNGKKVLK